jgi:molybdenum cofactor biosynthesis enzyme MoaA
MNINDYEIFKVPTYRPFENNGKTFQLSSVPYLDIVFNDHCNARCKFCIAHLVHKKIKSDIEAFKPKIRYAIEQLGVREVLLLGGEPTINDDIFDIIDYLKTFDIDKICLTTNGHRMVQDEDYARRLFMSGVTHVNLSLMNLDKQQQLDISGAKTYVGLEQLRHLGYLSYHKGVKLRINNNVFLGNHDTKESMLEFYNQVSPYCDSVKFSPLLKTDSFSTVNEVTEFNRTHLLSDERYDELWHSVEEHYADYPIVRNQKTFGFVPYSMICLPVPIILSYNQHGQLRRKVVEEHKINNLKLLVTGDLSLSWNREERDWMIKVP